MDMYDIIYNTIIEIIKNNEINIECDADWYDEESFECCFWLTSDATEIEDEQHIEDVYKIASEIAKIYQQANIRIITDQYPDIGPNYANFYCKIIICVANK